MHALTECVGVRTIFCHSESCCFSPLLFGSKDECTFGVYLNTLAECLERLTLLMCDFMFSCASVDICCGLCVYVHFIWRMTMNAVQQRIACAQEKNKAQRENEEKNDFMWNNDTKQSRKRKSEMHFCVVCAVGRSLGEKHLLRRLFT